jgi:hypothetical protein
MFPADYAYGATFYFMLPNYHWYQSTWQNLTTPSGSIPGQWNTVSVYVNDMTYNNKTLAQNSESGMMPIKWGLKIGQGGLSPDYTGFIYIDSIDVQ